MSDDRLAYVDSARGYIAILDPKTGAVKKWPSPSGPQSHPYAIAVIDDVIWYTSRTSVPDALVRLIQRPRSSRVGRSRRASASSVTCA